jgi:hypothetical protein
MSDLIRATIANYPLSCFVAGLIFALASIARAGRRDRGTFSGASVSAIS